MSDLVTLSKTNRAQLISDSSILDLTIEFLIVWAGYFRVPHTTHLSLTGFSKLPNSQQKKRALHTIIVLAGRMLVPLVVSKRLFWRPTDGSATGQGSHTIGKARCLSFRQRAYQTSPEEEYDRYERYNTYRRVLRSICPETGQDQRVAPLDFRTPARFDNHYFLNILEGKALLGSDNVLITQDHEGEITRQVWSYASDQTLFFASFVKSIVKMGNINVLTANLGEVRTNCRFTNH
ncbi:Peroxidase 20, partial [Cucurbita argyrosperma subsp. argyrosperma]